MNWKVFVSVMLISSTTFAQNPIVRWPPGEDKIVSLKLNEPAPFQGHLFSPETALRWKNAIEQYQFRLKLDVETEKKSCQVNLDYNAKVMKIDEQRYLRVEKDLMARLTRSEKARLASEYEARNPAWYETRTFGFIVGVVGTAAIMGVSIWALDKTGN